MDGYELFLRILIFLGCYLTLGFLWALLGIRFFPFNLL